MSSITATFLEPTVTEFATISSEPVSASYAIPPEPIDADPSFLNHVFPLFPREI